MSATGNQGAAKKYERTKIISTKVVQKEVSQLMQRLNEKYILGHTGRKNTKGNIAKKQKGNDRQPHKKISDNYLKVGDLRNMTPLAKLAALESYTDFSLIHEQRRNNFLREYVTEINKGTTTDLSTQKSQDENVESFNDKNSYLVLSKKNVFIENFNESDYTIKTQSYDKSPVAADETLTRLDLIKSQIVPDSSSDTKVTTAKLPKYKQSDISAGKVNTLADTFVQPQGSSSSKDVEYIHPDRYFNPFTPDGATKWPQHVKNAFTLIHRTDNLPVSYNVCVASNPQSSYFETDTHHVVITEDMGTISMADISKTEDGVSPKLFFSTKSIFISNKTEQTNKTKDREYTLLIDETMITLNADETQPDGIRSADERYEKIYSCTISQNVFHNTTADSKTSVLHMLGGYNTALSWILPIEYVDYAKQDIVRKSAKVFSCVNNIMRENSIGNSPHPTHKNYVPPGNMTMRYLTFGKTFCAAVLYNNSKNKKYGVVPAAVNGMHGQTTARRTRLIVWCPGTYSTNVLEVPFERKTMVRPDSRPASASEMISAPLRRSQTIRSQLDPSVVSQQRPSLNVSSRFTRQPPPAFDLEYELSRL